jgi:hypothetical protein
VYVRELFGDPNTHYYHDFSCGNKPPGKAYDARGISPNRWELK